MEIRLDDGMTFDAERLEKEKWSRSAGGRRSVMCCER